MKSKRAMRPPAERFFEKVAEAGDCLVWTAATMANGYGIFTVYHEDAGRFRNILAHRWAYQNAHGPIPDGLEIDHLCRVRNCVRIEHLQAVPHRENQRRMGQAVTHCRKAGHELTPENTYTNPKGMRCCRECKRDSDRRFRAKQRTAA